MRKKVLTIACLAAAILIVLSAMMSVSCTQAASPPPAQQQATPTLTLPRGGAARPQRPPTHRSHPRRGKH